MQVEEEMRKTHNTNPVKKRCKGSSSSSTTQTTHQISTTTSKHNNNNHPNPDLISALPDSLLLHILSFLDMNEVMKTSLLSRRWRYLWKSIPCLCFGSPSDFPGVEFTNFIDRCLFHHEGSKIHKLHINCEDDDDDTHAPLVDSWLHFAIRRKVEDFKLNFDFGCYNYDNVHQYDKHYRLPRSFYWCTTLTSLNLRRCNLNLPADSFQLSSLKTLTLKCLELFPDSIEHLSSSCPLLEEIYIIDCNRGRDLINIVITNEHVKKLEISNCGDDGSETVKINAPTLLSLGIYDCYPSIMFLVEELGSLMSADVSGKTCYCFENVVHCVEKLLYDFRHVKNLTLCGLRLQVLSLTKLKSSDILPISATSLELHASLKKWELPGIIYLLECCSNLQKLKIVNKDRCGGVMFSDEFIDEHDFEKEYRESFGTDVQPSIMQNIKTIEIDLGGESRHGVFVRFLLKNAKVLERMVIDTPKKYANNFELLFRLSQRLNAFPRSSPNAKLFIT